MEAVIRLIRIYKKGEGDDDGGFLRLFVSKNLIQGAAAAILGIFVPIFLYETSGGIFYVVGGYYALLSLLYLLLLAPGMYLVNRLGYSKALVLGGVFNVLLYVIMYILTPDNIWTWLWPLAIAIVAFRIFHWVPFHVDFTIFTRDGERGRRVGITMATVAFMGVIGPILAGFIISHAGYQALFGTAIVLLTLATISYFFVPETNMKYEWSLTETWSRLFDRRVRNVMAGEFANGAETMVQVVVWPIFLYEVLDGDVFEIGAVSTIVVGSTIVVQLLLGNHLDKKKGSKEKTLKVGSTLYAIGWIVKIFVVSAAQVFFVGLYHNIVRIFTRTPFTAITYDMSSEQGEYMDEFTVIREMAVHAGRVFSLITISVLTLFIPIGWTFVIAAVASLSLNLVHQVKNT